MSLLIDMLDRAYGAGSWVMGSSGIMVNGELRITKAQIKPWLAGQIKGFGRGIPVKPAPIVRPKPIIMPKLPPVVDTPMPFLHIAPTQNPKKQGAPKKIEALRCSRCRDIWEDCNCGLVWCPYCGFEPKSGTQRGLDMHIKARHKDIDWG